MGGGTDDLCCGYDEYANGSGAAGAAFGPAGRSIMAAENTVLFICGSLRKKSLNRQVGEYVEKLLQGNAQVHWLDYADLPFVNQDTEFPTPAPVQRVRDEVMDADALWVFSPEYNHGIPGVLKNCLDWLSRPLGPGSQDTAVKGKLTLFSCAGGGAKARYCAAALAETLSFMATDLVETVHTQVALDRHDYTTDDLVLAPAEEAALQTQARILLKRLG